MKKQKIQFTYDEIASALYIKVGKGKVEKTEEISPSSFVDYDKNGGIIGIEMLNTKKSKANKITLDLKSLQGIAF